MVARLLPGRCSKQEEEEDAGCVRPPKGKGGLAGEDGVEVYTVHATSLVLTHARTVSLGHAGIEGAHGHEYAECA